MKHEINFYGAIEKSESQSDGSLLVTGIASTESVDNSGEIVTAEAMRKALPSYLQSGSVREMHQPIAAGCPISAHVDDDGKTHFTAKIVDVGTISKIKANVLKGFSIGGKSIRKVGNTIHEILLKEISVVDLPCNGESVFTLIKFDKPADKKDDKHKDDCDCDDCKKSKKEKSMSAELLKKVEDLTALVTSLAATVKTISDKPAPDLTKLETTIGDLQKRADDAVKAAADSEKSTVIAKMQNESRVAYKDDGLAYKTDELAKLDLPLLKVLARNSQVLPTVAKTIYTGTGNIPDEKTFTKMVDGKEVPLKGSELIQRSWEHLDLQKMIAAGTTAGLK